MVGKGERDVWRFRHYAGASGHYADKFRVTEEIGRLRIARGEVDGSLADYQDAETGYEEFALFAEAIDVSMEIAETQRALGVDCENAIAQCQAVARTSGGAGMPRQAATALAAKGGDRRAHRD